MQQQSGEINYEQETTYADGEPPLPEHDRIYNPEPGERQLTLRAVLMGCLIGGVVGAMNISIGLKIGWSFGGSLIAAILGYGFFAAIRPTKHYTVLETNITQTTGSAAGSMASAAGLLAPIPALALLEDPVILEWWQLLLWAFAVAYLGVFFAVPLRRQMVVVEKLRFPTGTATAETIVSMFAESAEALRKARVLLIWAIIAAAVVLIQFGWFGYWPYGADIQDPPLLWLGAIGAFLTTWHFTLYVSPVMFGAGLLIGPRIGISLLLGAITGWLILGGLAQHYGWVADTSNAAIMSYDSGVRGWILWPGVAIMVGDALMSLALSWRTILNTFRPKRGRENLGMETEDERVPNSWWLGGLLIGATATVLVTWYFFQIPPWMTIIAVVLSAVLAAIAVRSTGETDINPVGGMGKVTQLAFGGLSKLAGQKLAAAIPTNLMGAAITGSGASQAADMMQDLKTGRMLGAMPRKQILAQFFGIAAGILVVVPIYALFDTVHDIGGAESDYPAPAAHAWRAMAEVLGQGFDALPTGAEIAALAGLAFGAMVPIVRKFAGPYGKYVPSGLAFGIAFIVPAKYPLAMFLGSMMLVAWRKLTPLMCAALVFAVASGLIAGDGVTNVLTALLELLGQWMGWVK